MKWIGQHIYDQVSKFRNDVYLENPTASGSDPDKFLGIDSNGKIVYRTGAEVASDIGAITSETGDISAVTAGEGLSGGGTTGAVTLTLDLSELDEITPTNGDSLATLDSDGSTEQLTTVANLATLFAGSGLTATNSVIAVDTLNQNTTGSSATCTGNAATATALAEAVTINGVDFDGTESITITAATVTAGTQAAITTLANVTTVGTIGTGVWQGTAIASAYLDADTMHYSAQRQLTHHQYKADQGTTKTYFGLGDADSEETTTSQKLELPIIAPAAGKLLKIFLRSNKNIQTHTLTWRLETIAAANFSATPSIIGTQSGAGCQNSTMTTYDFTTGLDSGTNAISAGNAAYISLESDTDFGNVVQYFITCLWEWDLS